MVANSLKTKINTDDLRSSVLPLVFNIVCTAALLCYFLIYNEPVEDIDYLDAAVESFSSLTYVFLFWSVFLVQLRKSLRPWFAGSLMTIQFGRLFDAADEVVVFNLSHASVIGDALTLTGELILVVTAIRWVVMASIQANTDPLTGLFNRRFHIMQLERMVRMASEKDDGFAIVALDLDHFKSINDQHGHAVGDSVIRHVADVIRDNSRAIDTVSRVGGEEYEILLPYCGGSHALVIAERLRAAIETDPPAPIQNLTCSLGVTVYEPGISASQIRLKADEALYESKRQGRNRVTPSWAMSGASQVRDHRLAGARS